MLMVLCATRQLSAHVRDVYPNAHTESSLGYRAPIPRRVTGDYADSGCSKNSTAEVTGTWQGYPTDDWHILLRALLTKRRLGVYPVHTPPP